VASKTPAKRVQRAPLKAVAKPHPANGDLTEEEEDEAIEIMQTADAVGEAVHTVMTAASKIRRGNTEAQKVMESTSTYAQSFRPDEKSQVIKFLEKDPYASYRRHWIESRNDSGQTVNRPYVCPLTFNEACPLCEVGDRPQAVSSYNIALCGDHGQVLLRSWDVGARLYNVIKAYGNDPKVGPLNKNFFLVNKTGSKQNTQYNVSPVRPSSLQEDYDTPVPSEESLAALKPYDAEVIELTPIKKLRELAAELTADYD
jgi:hypothetical protein